METVELANGADCATFELAGTTPTDSSHASSKGPSSSGSTPPSALLIPLARVLMFEAQISTLLYHMQPWWQKSITKVEEQIEKRVAQ